MTARIKDAFAEFFEKTIRILGGVIGGGLIFATFKPCCIKLKESLRDTKLTNLEVQKEENNDLTEVIVNDIVCGTELSGEMLEKVLRKEEYETDELIEENES